MAKKKYKVSVLGDGGWGTALAVVNNRHQNDVLLWSAFADYAEQIKETRENPKFLPGVKLDPGIQITSDLQEAIRFADIIALAIPTQYLRNLLYKIKEEKNYTRKIFVSLTKGIENKTTLRPSQIIHSILGNQVKIVILSGPSHAEEVARGMPTLIVAASSDKECSIRVQEAFGDTCFRVYAGNDVIGVELGAALKNVIALAAGICDGLKFGDNTKAGLLSRGLLEMTRLGIHLGANPNTFFGLSGLGDLITTCISGHGRNLRVGREIGEGKKVKEILAGMEMVAEGVETAKNAYELGQKAGISLPIISEVYRILYEGKNPRIAVEDLLGRHAHEEWKQQ